MAQNSQRRDADHEIGQSGATGPGRHNILLANQSDHMNDSSDNQSEPKTMQEHRFHTREFENQEKDERQRDILGKIAVNSDEAPQSGLIAVTVSDFVLVAAQGDAHAQHRHRQSEYRCIER